MLKYFLPVLLDAVPFRRDKTPRLVEALLEQIDSNNDNVATFIVRPSPNTAVLLPRPPRSAVELRATCAPRPSRQRS